MRGCLKPREYEEEQQQPAKKHIPVADHLHVLIISVRTSERLIIWQKAKEQLLACLNASMAYGDGETRLSYIQLLLTCGLDTWYNICITNVS